MKVWILFMIANAYDQPEKAFEKLYWEKPTLEELNTFFGYKADFPQTNVMLEGAEFVEDGNRYWIEEFTKD
jgi:hypothetical protein